MEEAKGHTPSAADAIARVAHRERSPRRCDLTAAPGTPEYPKVLPEGQKVSPELKELFAMIQKQQEQNTMIFQSQMKQNQQILEAMTHMMAQSSNQPPVVVPAPQVVVQQTAPKKLKQIPIAIANEIEKRARTFKTDVLKFSRSQKSLEKAKDDLNVFMATEVDYPKRCRQFKSSVSFTELDEKWMESCEGPHTISITIPQGSTTREAMANIHRSCAMALKQIDVAALESAVNNKRAAAEKDALKLIVEDVVLKATCSDYAAELGLPKPLDAAIDSEAIVAKTESIYGTIYKEINDKLKSEHDKALKAKSGEMKQVTEAKPAEVFESAVTSILDDHLQNLGLVDRPDDDNMNATTEEPGQKFLDSIAPKNGSSPSGGAGQNAGNPTGGQSRPRPSRWNGKGQKQWPTDGATWRPEGTPKKPWWTDIDRYARDKVYQTYRSNLWTYGSGDKNGAKKGRGSGKGQRR